MLNEQCDMKLSYEYREEYLSDNKKRYLHLVEECLSTHAFASVEWTWDEDNQYYHLYLRYKEDGNVVEEHYQLEEVE